MLWPTGIVLLLAGCPEPTKMPEQTELDLAVPGAEMGPVPDLREIDLPPEYPTAVPICTPPPNRWCWENPLPQGNELLAVWSFSPTDVWAAGETGTILHYDGMTWTAVQSGTEEGLWALWGGAPEDLWAVGRGGTILHWDGVKWSKIPGGENIWLRSVWGTGRMDVWAGGASQDLLRWDGTRWQKVPSGVTAHIWHVWGSAPDDYWAATSEARLLRWDGRKWNQIRSLLDGNFFSAIWGTGRDDVWFSTWVGARMQWDGRTFIDQTAGVLVPKAALWGIMPWDLWAARGRTVARWNGLMWNRVAAPLLDLANDESIGGISGTGPNDVWTISYRPHHWDGKGWYSPGGGTRASLSGGWATGSDDAWVVGVQRTNGVVLRRQAGRWTSMFRMAEYPLGVWASGANDVWIVGSAGLILVTVQGPC